MSLVDKYLESRPGKKRPRGVLYVTDLTKPCIRNAFFSITNPQPYPVNTLRIFESGNVLEDWWVSVLDKSKTINVLDTQTACYYKDDVLDIHGRLDILCHHSRGRVIGHEVKTIKSAKYVASNGAKPEHIKQLQFYINVLGLDVGQVDYIDKYVMLNGAEELDQVDHCFRQERDASLFAAMITRGRELMKCLDSGSAPAEKGWLCDYCLYNEECDE